MKSLTKIAAFILTLTGVICLLDFLYSISFGRDAGFLRHSGVGHVLFYILFVVNVIIFQKYVNREPFYALGFKRAPGWRRTFFKGWMVGVLAFIGYTLLMDSFGMIELRYRFGVGRFLIALLVGLTGFTIAATEEVLFRGFFLQTMMKDLPKWIAVVITGVIFVVFHKLGSIQDFWTKPYDMMLAGGIFCLHLWLCAAFFKSGALYLPIAIHAGLVSAKIVFRYMKLIEVNVTDSYWLGLNGDARRGFLAWILFLAGIFIVRFLVTKSNSEKGMSS